jgi:superfamily II DNA/RNA helicase
LVVRNGVRIVSRARLSLLRVMSSSEATFSTVDQSAMSKSRAPFSMPRNSQDDSVPQGQGGELSWSQLGLLNELVEGVFDDMSLEAPTPVQSMVIPKLLKEPPESLAFLAATGSGKTLAYLLPLLQAAKSQELFQGRTERRSKRPRILILAPTRELTNQIASVTKQLCHHIKLSSQVVVGGEDYGKQRKRLDRPIDVLIATPGRLLKHWKAGHIHLGDVDHIVLDEMDTMLEQGFQEDLGSILHPLVYQSATPTVDATPVETAPRIVLTSATMTQAVQTLVSNKEQNDSVSAKRHFSKEPSGSNAKIQLPHMNVITAPGLHRAVPRLKQVFVDVGNIDKLSLLVDAVAGAGGSGAAVKRQDQDDTALTLVFCNTVSSCRAAEHALAEAGLDSLCYHGELNSQARSENLKRFRKAGTDPNEPHVLVCTDLAARGLDVPEVDHVVMFDFPLNALDYLHRSGRTARGISSERAGNGRVTALVAKRDRVLAMAIENAVRRGEPLDGLSSRKSDYAPGSQNRSRDRHARNPKRGGPSPTRGRRSGDGPEQRASQSRGRRR